MVKKKERKVMSRVIGAVAGSVVMLLLVWALLGLAGVAIGSHDEITRSFVMAAELIRGVAR